MSACVYYATTHKIEYSVPRFFRNQTEEFFDALDELDCYYLHVDGSDLYEVEKTEARKLLKRLSKRDPGDYKTSNGLHKCDIVLALKDALKHGERESKYIHFYVF